jgi:protein-tyrosine phosphatase
MGNICRSPTAERCSGQLATRRALERLHIDSAGTHGYHAGAARLITRRNRRQWRVRLRHRRAARAPVEPEDFGRFHWISAMDPGQSSRPDRNAPARLSGHLGLYLDLAPHVGTREMPDPYYGGPDGFQRVLDLSEVVSNALVARLQRALARAESGARPAAKPLRAVATGR